MKNLSYNLKLVKEAVVDLIEDHFVEAGFVVEMDDVSQNVEGEEVSLKFTLDAIPYEITIKEG